jgi:hypothetical protein
MATQQARCVHDPLKAPQNGAHGPGGFSRMLSPLVQGQLSMPSALLSPYKRANLSVQQPAYGECRIRGHPVGQMEIPVERKRQ